MSVKTAPFRLGPLIKFAIVVFVIWTAFNWLMDIPEMIALKEGFQHGRLTDDDIRAAGDAVRARIDAMLGRAPASTAPTRSTPSTPPPRSTPAEPARRPQPPPEAPPQSEPTYALLLPPPPTSMLPPGVSLPGSGVTMPRLLRQEKPRYTSEALRAKIEGAVFLRAVVRTNGEAEQVSVVRSLDTRYGLDRQAIEAVRQWRFAPGQRFGQAVPVLVWIEIPFAIQK